MSSKSINSPKMTTTESAAAMKVPIPLEFVCPLTKEIIRKPLMTRNNINFERDAIISWIQNEDGKCPVTNKPLELSDLIPNRALEEKIAFWRWDNMLAEPENTTKTLSGYSKSSVIGIVSPKKKKIEKAFYRQIMASKMVRCL